MKYHFAIPAHDLEKSKRFYETLGFSVLKEYEKPEEQFGFVQMAHDGDFVLELVSHPSTQEFTAPSNPETLHVAVTVDDLPATLNTLATQGARILRPITDGVAVARFAFIADPSGFPVELVEPK